MSAKMSKETFQRFTLLYLIGQFPEGIFSSFRLQKVLYYATRDVDPKPFTFHHTRHGQYSYEAGVQLTLMLESGLVKRERLNGERGTALWQIGDNLEHFDVVRSFESAFPQLTPHFHKAIEEFGFMKQRELDERVHQDAILQQKPSGKVLHAATRSKWIKCALDDVENEDLELMLSPDLFGFIGQRTQEIANEGLTLPASHHGAAHN